MVELVEGCCRQLAWSFGWIRRSEERSQMVEMIRERTKEQSRVFDEQKGGERAKEQTVEQRDW